MKLVLPFEKSINFDNTIKEICSISLEHDITKNEEEILGNFIINGTYKDHELNINEIPFNYVLPFTVEFDKKVDVNSIEFSIDNFTYNCEDNILNIKIDYIVDAKEIIDENYNREEDVDLSYFLDETPVINERVDTPVEEIEEKNFVENIKKDDKTFNLVDDFVCYHLHIVKENETLQSIATLYNCDVSEIKHLKDNISVDEHVIVPIKNV